MNTSKDFEQWKRTWVLGILIYGTIWTFIILLNFFLPTNYIYSFPETILYALADYNIKPQLFWYVILSGSLGGTTSLFHSLYNALMGEKSSPQYFNGFYYLVQPISGAFMGIVVSLLIITIKNLFDLNFIYSSNGLALVMVTSYVAGHLQKYISGRVFQSDQFFCLKKEQPDDI